MCHEKLTEEHDYTLRQFSFLFLPDLTTIAKKERQLCLIILMYVSFADGFLCESSEPEALFQRQIRYAVTLFSAEWRFMRDMTDIGIFCK